MTCGFGQPPLAPGTTKAGGSRAPGFPRICPSLVTLLGATRIPERCSSRMEVPSTAPKEVVRLAASPSPDARRRAVAGGYYLDRRLGQPVDVRWPRLR